MATADALVIGAGAVSFAGNFAKSGGFPSNGYAIIGGTVALAFLAALTRNSPIQTPVKALAGLLLLVAVYVYVPAFTKGKNNG